MLGKISTPHSLKIRTRIGTLESDLKEKIYCSRVSWTLERVMAFEVARVHGLIRSNIGDDGLPIVFFPTSGDLQLPEYSHFPADFHYDTNGSGQWSESSGSPLESSACSTETESDEDEDLLAGLAEKIAHSMLEDEEGAALKNGSAKVNWSTELRQSPAVEVMKAYSPPSSWSGGSWVSASTPSSRSSSRVSSQVSSPPTTPLPVQDDAWDLLYAAAGEVVRQKINERRAMSFQVRVQQHQAYQAQQRAHAQWTQQALLAQFPTGFVAGKTSQALYPGSPHPVSNHPRPMSPRERSGSVVPQVQRSYSARGRDDDRRFSASQNRSSKPGHASGRGRPSRPQPLQLQQASRLGGNKSTQTQYRSGGTAEGNSSQWHNVPALNGGSGMRAVFLGSGGSGRESGGTGVFLPRNVSNGSDYKRKPACSTVLLPTRIVQVLNLNVEDMRTNPTSPCSPVHPNVARPDFSAALTPSPTAPCMIGAHACSSPKMCHKESWGLPHRKLNPSVLRQSVAPELSLPTEWTY